MSNETSGLPTNRRAALACLLTGAAGAVLAGREDGAARTGFGTRQDPPRDMDEGLANPLLWAVAWKQTAAEYRALCHQAFNLARLLVDQALAAARPGGRPLAIVTDVDDTVLHADSYWGHLVEQNRDFFDDRIWDRWIPKNLVTAAPGALDFLRYAAEQRVEVFYVTNRDQGEATYRLALDHLRVLGFPFADADHLTVLRDTSDKTGPRERIAERYEIVLLLGDNLNDFKRDYYVTDVDERIARMEADRHLFGRRFVVLPNPTDGHWIRAIFGDSEPVASEANRRTLRRAAARVAWDGRD